MKRTLKTTCLICLVLIAFSLLLTACNDNKSAPEQANPISDHTHVYSKWTVSKAATCTEDGVKERDCSCGEIQTASIPATSHSFVWETVKEDTCTEDGLKEGVCACGERQTQVVEGAHAWTDATCLSAKTCTKCNLTEGSALGHTTTVGTCSRCQQEVTPPIELPNTPISTSVKFSFAKTTMTITDITYEFDGDTLRFYYSGEKTFDDVEDSGTYFCGFTYKLYDADGYVVDSDTESVHDISVGDKFRGESFTIYDVPSSSSYTLVIEDYQ